MNFFEYQKTARRRTFLLIILFSLAVVFLTVVTIYTFLLLPIENKNYFYYLSFIIPSVILICSIYKIIQLNQGGQVIAKQMKATPLNYKKNRNIEEQQLLNVVMEMAIAANIKPPLTYLLSREMSINAFTVGTHINNNVIIINEGCLSLLNRDELQALIAHEFSHIEHNDVIVNTRILGILFGITFLYELGNYFFDCYQQHKKEKLIHHAVFNPENMQYVHYFIFGIILKTLGFLGYLLATMIKVAICRQQNFLADSTAVRYCRNPEALVNILKKIGGYQGYPYYVFANVKNIEHMLFNANYNPIYEFKIFHTHPSIHERIYHLDPNWDGHFIHIAKAYSVDKQATYDAQKAAQVLGVFTSAQSYKIYQANQKELSRVEKLIASLPEYWYDFAMNPQRVNSVYYALFLNSKAPEFDKQIEFIRSQDSSQLNYTLTLLKSKHRMRSEHILLLANIANLRELSLEEKHNQFILKNLNKLLAMNNHAMGLFEWCIYAILSSHTHLSRNTNQINYVQINEVQEACQHLFSFIAQLSTSESFYQIAFDKAIIITPLDYPFNQFKKDITISTIIQNIHQIYQLDPYQKPFIVKAIIAVIQTDGIINIEERAILKAVCAIIDSPFPPLD